MRKKRPIKNRFKILILYLIISIINFSVYDMLTMPNHIIEQFIITSIAILILVFIFLDNIWEVTIL